MPEGQKTAIVVGASSGIGAACVRDLAARGFDVAIVARREDKLQTVAASASGGKVTPWKHDVTAFEEVPDLFSRIVEDLGGSLDMIIYAAAIMPDCDIDTWNFDDDKAVIDTNLTGCMAWLNQAGPLLRKQGSGSIVGISSIAGDRGRVKFPAYNTSKAAMNTYLEALRNRLCRHGVRVTTIKPGYVATSMTEGKAGLFWVASADQAGKAVVDAGLKGKNTRYVFRRWWIVATVIRCIPSFIFRRLNV
ncbi:MAG: short-chain dehydrogenase [Planctomycetes bacterium]|nr:short-chain dehydrogenase [Planctomycetota bacterium]